MSDFLSSGSVDGQIRAVAQKVEMLASSMASAGKPWYRDATTVIASVAFVFSLATTAFSFVQTRQAQDHDQRVELRGLIQRQIDLEKELQTVPVTYSDPAIQTALRGYVAKD